ncbi:MAG: sulfurtransferase TusA family protein [Deltaproteobacteria bacterium]|nr:sulfurtransferase TusA family protein [Deltaproteobacteria bacterium]
MADEVKPEVKPEVKANDSIDLRGVMCPTNFVKTKLKLESMEKGQVLEVLLDTGEPIQNVPKSVKEEGHKIVEVNREGDHFKIKIEVSE